MRPTGKRSSHKSTQSTRGSQASATKPARGAGHIRIIGGRWRGRKLPVPDLPGLRPTTDRVKETVFNWLQFEVHDKRVLDAFAGTGSLGFEALSRGARSVTFVEKARSAAAQLTANVHTLNAQANTHVCHQDALEYLAHTSETFDLVLLDPPFEHGFLSTAIEHLKLRNLVVPDGWIYLESESSLTVVAPENWRLHREKKMGQVICRLYQVMH
ncbi:16S rRNA (guanine(966)-N(2))-methyltransferase RsmD [Aliidiomarina sanyensis]|uniref:Ribosomal RNA small subunit methyltransferase D n=1 Tax=Aliidiomarina sanyensis TaxID=1249555 RepID=A0A432WPI6_9GAMM|nr:16S rRNA (guanine(966)-N(2))-methyltransferase RsmD [Aliidiomarina sanyensis]RUO35685.1 16S rRNA (guanine(966)-N(2))-methyltransferase RsmD [Aliidiomarina sanyensis]